MGWWWSSDSTATPVSEFAPSETTQRPTPVSTTTTHREEAPKKPSPDSEFEALFASFERPSNPAPPAPQRSIVTQEIQHVTPAPKETPTNYVPSPSGSVEQRSESDAPLDISPEALYPRQMSCRQAFDQAFYCQSLGGKFNDIYRYGELRSCSDNWNAFWFCMRIKTLPDREREDRIKEFYQAQDEEKKAEKGSSEKIWDLRTEPVAKAFWKDPDEVTEKN
ncbi:hypothetical protein E4T44_13330 [Aureobasidium sp. EXF-8845]|jgi:hypothetical protein|nr:hypothetical protein E4T44_13330 [Aureobasidium sp. EXF-8845]KAI4796538.1 hypothetical protein E4T45_11975 [Aureobasidium sp. EXF-8846]